jgi:hypothetical protein
VKPALLWIPAVPILCWVLFNTAGWLSVRRNRYGVPIPFSWRIYTRGPWYIDDCWRRR